MKLKDYIKLVEEVNGKIVAFGYYFNGERDESADIEEFSINEDALVLEDLSFSMDVEGEVINDTFCFLDGKDSIGLEAMI